MAQISSLCGRVIHALVLALSLSRSSSLATPLVGKPTLGSELDAELQRPRMLVMLGCSGSSILMKVAKDLLQAHGVATATPGGGPSGELIKPPGNPFFKQERGMGRAMELARDHTTRSNATLIFKEQGAQSPAFRDAAPSLQRMGTYVVHSYRANALDRLVCQVKDCVIPKTYGVPVDADGARSKLCFKRRVLKESASAYSAKLSIDSLVSTLKSYVRAGKEEDARIRKAGFGDYPTLLAEDLLDFEHDATAFDRAVTAWEEFLTAWGVTPQRKILDSILNTYIGTYAAESQSQSIYNFHEVREVLRAEPELAGLLRE